MKENNAKVTILLLEDDDEDAFLFNKLLNKQPSSYNYEITRVTKVEDAETLLQETNFTLVVADLFVIDSSGLETFYRLYKVAECIPIVILSGTSNEKLALEAVSKGAQDYVPKNEITSSLLSRVLHYAIERHHIQESLRLLSLTDGLTGLYNRRGFFSLAQQHLNFSSRLKHGAYLFLFDLDQLKDINDHYGHSEGDNALRKTAECLKHAFRASDVIGRIGGDEFSVLALNVSYAQGKSLKQNVENVFKDYNQTCPHPYKIRISMGMAFYNLVDKKNLEELLEIADKDLYEEKKRYK